MAVYDHHTVPMSRGVMISCFGFPTGSYLALKHIAYCVAISYRHHWRTYNQEQMRWL